MASVKFPTFPSIDFSKLDMPKFELPKFDMPSLEIPKVDTEAVTEAVTKAVTEVTKVAKDAAYVTIGLATLAVQKAQIRRREIATALADQFGTGKAQIEEVVDAIEARLATLDSRLVAFEGKLDVAVEDLEKRLPERAGALLGSAHTAAKSAREQVRSRLVKAA